MSTLPSPLARFPPPPEPLPVLELLDVPLLELFEEPLPEVALEELLLFPEELPLELFVLPDVLATALVFELVALDELLEEEGLYRIANGEKCDTSKVRKEIPFVLEPLAFSSFVNVSFPSPTYRLPVSSV